MLKRLIKQFLNWIFDRHLPAASVQELEYLSELRSTFRQLPVVNAENAEPSQAAWLGNMNRLRDHILNDDPRKFARWDVVSNTMVVGYENYIKSELSYLRRLPHWATRWRAALEEPSIGNLPRYPFYLASSANTVHHAYHLAQFEEKTRKRIEDMDCVFEFGGGYGNLCRLLYGLGFRGRYVLFDLPPFSALQRYYLKTAALPVDSKIICLSDAEKLRTALAEFGGNKLFVATWSISETPLSIRNSILSAVSKFDYFLIAYQDQFQEVNNLHYFDSWKRDIRVAWQNWPIEHLPASNYLIGSRYANA